MAPAGTAQCDAAPRPVVSSQASEVTASACALNRSGGWHSSAPPAAPLAPAAPAAHEHNAQKRSETLRNAQERAAGEATVWGATKEMRRRWIRQGCIISLAPFAGAPLLPVSAVSKIETVPCACPAAMSGPLAATQSTRDPCPGSSSAGSSTVSPLGISEERTWRKPRQGRRLSPKGGGNAGQRHCLGREGGGNARQRQRLHHDGSGNARQRQRLN